jgi:hypothetical protein
MKRINKKFREPIPETDGTILESHSLRFDITLRTKMEDFLFTVLLCDTIIDTFPTEAIVTTWTNPFRRFRGMVFANRFHSVVPPVHWTACCQIFSTKRPYEYILYTFTKFRLV